ncbi:indora [Wolbachia endosymbiont of Drosophila ananassae]|nr:indora [Wolbachia endosymbiont of Drosophila ananassae]
MAFGVPETIVSDNGSQFRSEAFRRLTDKYEISHSFTAVHSPQANASERVNRSVIAGIRSYLRPDQKDWDEHISHICCSLRSSVHSSIGTSPYYMAFGQHMITSGSTYALLRKLNLLDDRSLLLNRSDSFEIVRQQASSHMLKAYEENAKRYNLRARQVDFKEGQEVYRRNFRQSCFQTGYNSKFGPAFIKARVRKKIGNSYYELEDLQGHLIGSYHAKDIRQ